MTTTRDPLARLSAFPVQFEAWRRGLSDDDLSTLTRAAAAHLSDHGPVSDGFEVMQAECRRRAEERGVLPLFEGAVESGAPVADVFDRFVSRA